MGSKEAAADETSPLLGDGINGGSFQCSDRIIHDVNHGGDTVVASQEEVDEVNTGVIDIPETEGVGVHLSF